MILGPGRLSGRRRLDCDDLDCEHPACNELDFERMADDFTDDDDDWADRTYGDPDMLPPFWA